MVRQRIVRQSRITSTIGVNRVQQLKNKGYTQQGNILSSPKKRFLKTFDPDPSFRKFSTFSSHVLELDNEGRVKKEIRQRPRITSTAGRSSFRRIIPFEIKNFDFKKMILTTTRPRTAFRTARHIQSTLKKKAKPPVVVKRRGVTSIKVPISGGRTQTVTSTGRVTIRDSRGKVVKDGVFQADVGKAKDFIKSTSAVIKKQVAAKRRISIAIGKDPRVVALEKAGITKARMVFQLVKEGRLGIRGRDIILKTFKQERDVEKKFLGGSINATQKKKGFEELRQRAKNVLSQAEFKLISFVETGVISRKPLKERAKEIADLRDKIRKAGRKAKQSDINKLARLQRQQGIALIKVLPGTITRGVASGLLATGLFAGRFFTDPGKTSVQQARAMTVDLPKTIRDTWRELGVDPVGVVTQFVIFNEVMGAAGKTVKGSGLGRFITRKAFLIRNVPKALRKPVEILLIAADKQAKIKPFKVKDVGKIDFFEIKSLTRPEAVAVSKAITQTDSVVFGSVASRALSRKRTLPPKDVDIGTKNIAVFNRVFIESLPFRLRKNYRIRGEKLIRISNGQALYDIKNLSRVIPQRSLLTRKGVLPVTGISRTLKITRFTIDNVKTLRIELKGAIKRLREIKPENKAQRLAVARNITKAKSLLRLATKKGLRSSRVVKALERRGTIPSLTAPFFKKGLKVGLEVPTQRLVKVGGVKLVSFGEQTLRKGLGTLQVILEKELRRAKDPQAFLLGLEIQRGALRQTKPLTPIGRLSRNRRVKALSNAITLLRSKEFSRLLESRVPGITRQFPLVKKINPKKLRRVKTAPIMRRVRQSNDRMKKLVNEVENLRKRKSSKQVRKRINDLNREIRLFTSESRLPPSRLPRSILPSKLPSKVPSKLPSKVPSRLPSKIPVSRIPSSSVFRSRVPSGLGPSIITSGFPSKIPPVKPSKLPSSRLPVSGVSKIGVSKLPRKRVVRPPVKKPFVPEKRKVVELVKLVDKSVKGEKFIFIPDLYSVVYNIKSSLAEKKAFLRAGRLFTGFERRKLIRK